MSTVKKKSSAKRRVLYKIKTYWGLERLKFKVEIFSKEGYVQQVEYSLFRGGGSGSKWQVFTLMILTCHRWEEM